MLLASNEVQKKKGFLINQDVRRSHDCPRHRPYLNKFELLWWEAKKQVFQRKPVSRQELGDYFQEEIRNHSQ